MSKVRPELKELYNRLEKTLDHTRSEAREKRYSRGNRTARENLNDLIDENSFIEFGQLAVAAQRNRRDYQELQSSTAADGVLTGLCTINKNKIGLNNAHAIAIINDYSVLAGTQGFFHHKKLDRMLELAEQYLLPIIMFTEGGGGRPGDTDVTTQIAGLNVTSFASWARLKGKVPRISVNNGFCFAGNAALFGSADFRIATKNSWIGMAGPAMIEGGGLGIFQPNEIGPTDLQEKNGVIDFIASDEEHATKVAKQLLSFFQGKEEKWVMQDQDLLENSIPKNRRMSYPVRKIIETIADEDSFLELRKIYGRSIITGFIRIEGYPMALIANDCQQMGGAIDAIAADKLGEFITICDAHSIPILSFLDTPGFMVGPESEEQGAVKKMSSLFGYGTSLSIPIIAIVLRKAYGLGAMAMVGGSFLEPSYIASWPTGEFGAMGLEGAVKLGFKKELEAESDEVKKEDLFNDLLAKMYEAGKATEAASHLEIDAVIDPKHTRDIIVKILNSSMASVD